MSAIGLQELLRVEWVVAQVVAALLAVGGPEQSVCGPAGSSHPDVDAAMEVVERWPHPAFRAALLQLIESDRPEAIATGIAGLAWFPDEDSRARLDALAKDDRVLRGDRTIGDIVQSARERVAAGMRPGVVLQPIEGLFDVIPGADLIVWQYAGAVSLPVAIAQLRDPSDSVALQAFAALASRSVCVDAGPLIRSWTDLTEEQRRTLLGYAHWVKWNREFLRDELAKGIVERHGWPREQREVYQYLLKFVAGHPAATAEAIRVLRSTPLDLLVVSEPADDENYEVWEQEQQLLRSAVHALGVGHGAEREKLLAELHHRRGEPAVDALLVMLSSYGTTAAELSPLWEALDQADIPAKGRSLEQAWFGLDITKLSPEACRMLACRLANRVARLIEARDGKPLFLTPPFTPADRELLACARKLERLAGRPPDMSGPTLEGGISTDWLGRAMEVVEYARERMDCAPDERDSR